MTIGRAPEAAAGALAAGPALTPAPAAVPGPAVPGPAPTSSAPTSSAPTLPRLPDAPPARPQHLSQAQRRENFPVALRVLPADVRRHLEAVYDVARVIDDLGDRGAAGTGSGHPGTGRDAGEPDRTQLLHDFAVDLHRVWSGGTPHHPVLQRLVPTARETGLPQEPFDRLIEANLQDQQVASYATWDDLRAYCRLSADPVGRLVLHVFGVRDERAAALSDQVCTALQLLEHLQDVAEDRRAGRVYLPEADLVAFGVAPADLDAPAASPALRRLVAFETDRAADLLAAGAPLVALLRGWARVAVAGFVAGGWAAVRALRRPDADVLVAAPPARRADVARTAPLLLAGRSPRETGLAAAYDECVAITGREARNFAYGIRLLPRDKHAVMCAVYALARRIDDIGDGDLPLPDKHARLAEVRAALHGPAPERDPDRVLTALRDAARRYPIPLGAFDELVEGVEMDLAGRTYETFDDLVAYCRCVAGSVGRLCLGVFGSRPDPQAPAWADALGIALQQTNILRDVREDLANGRVYLPQAELAAAGVELRLDASGAVADPDGALADLVRACAVRARGWYDEGLQLVPLLDHRSAACTTAMAGIYAELLRRIEADPRLVLSQRVSLSGRQKAGVALRALVTGAS